MSIEETSRDTTTAFYYCTTECTGSSRRLGHFYMDLNTEMENETAVVKEVRWVKWGTYT